MQILMLIFAIFSVLISTMAFSKESAMATLPLKEVIRLNMVEDQSKRTREIIPPVAYTVETFQLGARLLDDAVEVNADFTLSVLASGWVKIELLDLDVATQIIELPQLSHSYFKEENNKLMFLSKKKGRYQFSVRFIKTAEKQENLRSVTLNRYGTMAKMKLDYDTGLFELLAPKVYRYSDSQTLYAENDIFHLQWQRRGDRKLAEIPLEQQPIEPIVKTAYASVVATLSGERIFRIQYQLRFTGEKELILNMAQSQRIEQIYLNAVAVPFSEIDHVVKLLVAPLRVGDEMANLELLIREKQNAYHLSGGLVFEFPRVSWGVNNFYVSLHLPQVFNYTWTGGTLAPNIHKLSANYNYEIPTPGKVFELHQQLISSDSNVRLDYTVDLTERYFTGR